jgi:hypothetical protein
VGKAIIPEEMIGLKFGRLTVTRYKGYYSKSGNPKSKDHHYSCECECGNRKIHSRKNLLQGNSNSCGCLHKKLLSDRLTKHGMTNSRIYHLYYSMIDRCKNNTDQNWNRYGGRGVSVCEEWLGENGFQNFYTWSMKSGYNDNLTIDRKDNDGNYEPKNCRWITRKEQSSNTCKSNIVVAKSPDGEMFGVANMTEFIKEFNLTRSCVYDCLSGKTAQYKGWEFSYKNNDKKGDANYGKALLQKQ